MREILFRGKRIDNGEWVEGDLLRTKFYLDDYEHSLIFTATVEFPRSEFGGANEVSSESVGQFTGIIDKNGKRIFEGDIVKHYNRMQEPEAYEVGCIYYDDVHCKWRRTKADDADKFNPEIRAYAKYEVIGNIHDNPELLAEVEE